MRQFCKKVHVKEKSWKHPDMRMREEKEERNRVGGSSDTKMGSQRKAPALQEQEQF